ncbi:MAG: ribulose-phosphate 3-epimerase [Candidatus Wildermuthbacteria bacterium]|nr:ribulose-phosphate 3-epimerase [Candidatus Wildermuthbacteria bacterium]
MQKIIPAILTSDPADLRTKLTLFKGQSNWLHIDIMDNKFVPNVSVNLFELGEASQHFNLEIHLMAQNPISYFEDCKEIGAKRVVFHYEAESDVEKVKKEAEKHEFQLGLALNPSTGVQPLAVFRNILDSVLLMGVEPGAQGHEFVPSTLLKAQETRKLCPDLLLGADGGIGEENIKAMFSAGVDYAVVGSKIMNTQDPVAAFRKLEEMVQ